MACKALKPKLALNKAYLKVKPTRVYIDCFKANLITLLNSTNDTESEEFHKNLVAYFLNDTYYKQKHFINTKGRNDMVIHNGPTANTTVGIILEAKKPTNKTEMIRPFADGDSQQQMLAKLNTKAFQELVLYYLRERITLKNLEVKHVIATNINEWFIFDATLFDSLFAQNKTFVQKFIDFEAGRLADNKTEFFYKHIAEPFINNITADIEFAYFNIQNYQTPLRNNNPTDDNVLIALYKLLSPEHLLKLPFTNDSNSLDKQFYTELLHIVGLTEVKDGGKKLITRNIEGERNPGTLLEAAILQLDSLDKINRLKKPSQYGSTPQERLFSVALELSITWINRILFLKLLEAQLINYHKGNQAYSFLNLNKIKNYDDLNSLFFQVLARDYDDRNIDLKELFKHVPYLNSSLFEPTEVEQLTLFISNLTNTKTIPIIATTVLKDPLGKKRTGNLNTLTYLFEFLNAYDFSSEGAHQIQEDNKTLINAAVLGLIFEKINGYKDGSFFTPGFITMYMCKTTIRKAVVQKFNETKNWACNTLNDLYNKIDDRNEANEIVNSLKICDPAVGSGHFLVSALNEIIAVKNDLKILQDRNGKRLKEYHVTVVNDELIVTDEDGELFEYHPNNKESQRIQEALFYEKQTIIENCLFGVDINTNSVKICRLRLWIELLKNAYYKTPTALETLPNIDINIKCGNSLISRFAINADLKQALKKSKWTIDTYRIAVATYRNAQNKEQKREMERLIENIKADFRSEIYIGDPKNKKLSKLNGELYNLTNQVSLFEQTPKQKAIWYNEVKLLTEETQKLNTELEDIKNNKIFDNAFEWRFEFPEVLNNDGDFIGFDVIIGNPPYISAVTMKRDKATKEYFNFNYNLVNGTYDIYTLFIAKLKAITSKTGIYSYIVPNKFLIAKYSEALIAELINTKSITYSINLSRHKIFDEAAVYPIIIYGQINNSDQFKKYTVYDLVKFIKKGIIVLDTELKKYPTLKDSNFKIQGGLAGFQAESIKKYLTNFKSKKSIPFTVSGCIDRYNLSNTNVRYMGNKYKNGNILIDCGLSTGKLAFWNNSKIVIAGMTKVIEAVYVESKLAMGVGIYGIEVQSQTEGYVLTGILNSKFISYYFNEKFKDKALAGGYLAINKNTIENIPFIAPNEKIANKLFELSVRIHEMKRENKLSNTTKLEAQIDKIVYKLYNLTNEEILIVENIKK